MTTAEAAGMTAMEYAIKTNAETRARAKAEGWTFWTTLPEDEAYWASSDLKTGEDVLRRDLLATYSDVYKEINGFRPRFSFESCTILEIEEALNELFPSESIPEAPPADLSKPLTYSPFANLKL